MGVSFALRASTLSLLACKRRCTDQDFCDLFETSEEGGAGSEGEAGGKNMYKLNVAR